MNHGVIFTIIAKNVSISPAAALGGRGGSCDSDFVQVHHSSTMKFKLDSVVLLLVTLLTSTRATEYFVSLEGNDDNPGTLQKPWQHVQHAVTVLRPGDICTIREGRYSEEVVISGLQGTVDDPITFRSYPGENVVFDGTTPITTSWEKYKDSIYVTTIQNDIWQLFVDGEMQINARWPNAFWYDFSVFDYTRWGFSSANSTYNEDTGTGVMVDNGTQDLADSGLNATGSIAILNIGSWLTWAGLVESHTPGESNFTYNLHQVPHEVSFKAINARYFLEDKLEFLDAPTEWFYDPKTHKLYLWTASGESPQTYEISGKVSTYAFTITNGSAWLILSGLDFFSTTVYISGTTEDTNVHSIRLESLYFSYPSYSKRMLGSLAVPNTTTLYYIGLLTKYAGNFTVFNCTWEYADGQTMKYRGADGVFENNLWHHNDFTCVGDGNLFASEGVRDQFVRNTVHSNGPSVGFSPGAGTGPDRELGLPTGADVRLNMFYDLKYLQDDGAHVQTQIASQNGTILEYNWCYDTRKWGLRFDREMKPNAMWGYNGTMRYNVVWGTMGMSIKGDDHHIHNNLAFDSLSYYDIILFGFPGSGMKGENEHTVTSSNIAQAGVCSSKQTQNCTYVPGKFTNNAIGNVSTHLRDPDNLDYRPKLNSDYIIKGIGPYGKESMEHGGVYWIPGHQQTLASIPIPPNGTTTAKCDADLMWLAGYGATAHDVYFGTNQTAVARANHSSPEFLGQFKAPSNVVEPGKLQPETLYYWRVDSVQANMKSLSTGCVWQFKCQATFN